MSSPVTFVEAATTRRRCTGDRHPIDVEIIWRSPRRDSEPSADVIAQRWANRSNVMANVENDGNCALHCVALNLKGTSVHFTHGGRSLCSGRLHAGVAHVGMPGVAARAQFSNSYDVLHLYVSQRVLSECYEDLFGRPPFGELVIGDGRLLRDPAIARLGQALAVTQTSDASLGKVFADSVSLAIVSRLVGRQYALPRRGAREVGDLPKWRMARVTEYVDANLSEPIGLVEMAESTGLTRMHFAAQFRQATGMSPHEYLLRRRVEHAESLLTNTRRKVLDIAMSCGFRTQAHFTTVFKRLVGATPCVWRKNQTGNRL